MNTWAIKNYTFLTQDLNKHLNKQMNKPRPKCSCWSSSPSQLDPKYDPKSMTPSRVLDAILMLELLNQYVIASIFDFEYFVEAKYRLRSWLNTETQ